MSGGCTVILASAGTGKTWQLTTRFLELVARGEPVERILASTFTRKAAAEILDRIFQRLAAGSASDEQARKLGDELRVTEFTRERALALTAALARELPRFQVSTLDAFFVRAAQAFSLELGLAPGWRILDEREEARLRDAAVAAVLARADRAEWAALLRQLRRDESSRSVHGALLNAVGGALECYADSGEAAWSAILPPAPLAPEVIAAAISTLEAIELPRTKKGEINSHWKKALAHSLRTASAGAWSEFLDKGLPSKILSCEGAYHGAEIDEQVELAFEPLMAQARAELGRELVEQSRATWRVCSEFQREYERLRRASGGMRFELLPRLLEPRFVGALRSPGSSTLATRLGAPIDHLLLDEFQDTSPAQWKVLRNFAEDLCARRSGGASFFCVGDPKQSIYAWRQAEPRLLIELSSRLPGAEQLELRENRRSASAVLETVHALFESLDENPALAMPEREIERAVAADFRSRWKKPVAHDPELPGSALLRTSAFADEGSAGPKPAWLLAAERAVDLHLRAPERTIAILVRRKVPIPFLLHELLRRGVRASGEGGNPLTDSAAVNVALSAIQLADHPGDGARHFHVATSPLAGELGLTVDDAPAAVAAWASARRRQLCERGVADFLRTLEPRVAERYGAWDRGRFAQLVELAIALDPRLALRPSEFVAAVEARRVEDVAASRVRVMTIHAAKGLEFDAVILPELDQRLGGAVQPALVARRSGDDPLEPYERVSRYPDKILQQLFPELADMRARTHRRRVMEELCVLYVAMTRAIHHLELIVGPRAGANLPCSFEGLLRGALPLADEAPSAVLWSHARSDMSPFATSESAPAAAVGEAKGVCSPIRFASPRRARELDRVGPSALAHRSRMLAEELFAPDSEARRRGRRIHAWLERIEWLELSVPSDAELLAIARGPGLAGPELAADLARFRGALAKPALRALLSRAECAVRLGVDPSALEVWRERRFALVRERGTAAEQLLHGAFDRAVLARSGGRFVRAELVDFKTDRLDGDAARLAARAEEYRPQLEAYREALSRIAGIPRERVVCRAAFLEEDRVLDL